MQAKLTRGEEDMTSTVRSKWDGNHCVKQEMIGRGVSEECVSTRRLAAILNKGVVTVDYNEMPGPVQNATARAADLLAYWLAPYVYDNQVQVANVDNQMRIESIYYPIIGSMDLRVHRPRSSTFYHGIRMHPVAEAVLPFNPRLSAVHALFGAPGLCLIDEQAVTTYDGLTYNASMSACDKVLTKDCSGRYKMAVLARQQADQKERIVVTVLLDREVIEIDAAALKIRVNGVERDLSQQQQQQQEQSHRVVDADQQTVAIVRRTRDQFVELKSLSHSIRVTTNGQEVIVLGSPVHRGRMCGLCGSHTGNKVDDLTGPRQCSLPADLMDSAYELNRPQGCQGSRSSPDDRLPLRRVQNACLKKEADSAVFGASDAFHPLVPRFQQPLVSRLIRSSVEPESNCTVFRNKMVHRGRKRCFSVASVAKCADDCQPESMVDQNVSKTLSDEKLNQLLLIDRQFNQLQLLLVCFVLFGLVDFSWDSTALNPVLCLIS